MKTCETVLAVVQKIKFFTDPIKDKTKFHITLGHQTALGLVHFFSLEGGADKFLFNKASLKNEDNNFEFDFTKQYQYEPEIVGDVLPGGAKTAAKEEEKSAET